MCQAVEWFGTGETPICRLRRPLLKSNRPASRAGCVLRDGVTVARLTLDQLVQVRILAPQPDLRRIRLAAQDAALSRRRSRVRIPYAPPASTAGRIPARPFCWRATLTRPVNHMIDTEAAYTRLRGILSPCRNSPAVTRCSSSCLPRARDISSAIRERPSRRSWTLSRTTPSSSTSWRSTKASLPVSPTATREPAAGPRFFNCTSHRASAMRWACSTTRTALTRRSWCTPDSIHKRAVRRNRSSRATWSVSPSRSPSGRPRRKTHTRCRSSFAAPSSWQWSRRKAQCSSPCPRTSWTRKPTL